MLIKHIISTSSSLLVRAQKSYEKKIKHKTALVRAHYKGKDNKDDPDSYIPISVLAPLAKVFESLISTAISSHFESNSLFAQHQFGFRKNLSCEHDLNLMMDELRVKLDDRKSTIAIFLFSQSI